MSQNDADPPSEPEGPPPTRRDEPAGDQAPTDQPRARRRVRAKSARKKQRNKQADDFEPLNAQGRERPRFLASFPDDPELNELARAFESGNYALVRRRAPELAERTRDEEVRERALELAERIKPDPLAKYMLLMSVLLLVYLVFYAYSKHG